MKKKLSVIIPVYNEETTIIKILKKINNLSFDNTDIEIIVVDDNSEDSSLTLLKKNKNLLSKLMINEKNKGKGHCIKRGLKEATGDYVIFQDADDEYDPIEFKKFIKIYEKFDADLIVSTRMNYDEYRSAGNFFNKIGNHIITNTFNVLFNTSFTDIYSCYISFKRELLFWN